MSAFVLLMPVLIFGWLIMSLCMWLIIPSLCWFEMLVIAVCVTLTDSFLASTVIGKGKFAKSVPKHLRDTFLTEAGCNNNMAVPFLFLAFLFLKHNGNHKLVLYLSFFFVVIT